MLNLNENRLRLSGTANLSKPLTLNSNYDMIIKNGEVRSSKKVINDDGSYDEIYQLVITPLTEIEIVGNNEIVKAQKKGTMSQVLRREIIDWADDEGKDRETFYQEKMITIINEVKERRDLQK